MARCTRTQNLEVHHRSQTGGNGIDNAKVLCQRCHQITLTHGPPGQSPPDFDEATKQRAIKNAWNRCECTSSAGCH
jgi:hypothetical protein